MEVQTLNRGDFMLSLLTLGIVFIDILSTMKSSQQTVFSNTMTSATF